MFARRSTRIVALILTAVWLGGRDAEAGLTLTSTAITQGFGLSVFASGFPTSNGVGPLGVAFTASGGVLVSDAPGNVRLFATDTDGQNAASAPVGQNFGGYATAVGLAQVGFTYYMARQANGDVVQINANGTLNQVIVTGVPAATGLIADPANGHLFVSTIGNNLIYDIDPIAKTKTLFESGTEFDGLSISGDGKTLYGASNNGHIYGYDTTTKAVVFDSGAIPDGIDGTALGTGTLAGNIFVNTNGGSNGGTVYEVNLTTLTRTLIASGGSRGDFVTVDPNGTLLLTQLDSIYRLTAPTGGGFGSVPEPSSIVLVGMGCVGTLVYARRRKAG